MVRRVILSPDAKEHIRSAIRWYVRQQLDLRFRFRAELRTTLRRVRQNPFQFPLGEDRLRRALMNRFPYAIYFRLNPEGIVVAGVVHQRRLNPILFIDELHLLVTRISDGAAGLGSLIRLALSQGRFTIISETTPDHWR